MQYSNMLTKPKQNMRSILDNLSGCKKGKLNEDTAVLELVLEFPSEPVEKPRLSTY